MSTGSSKVVVLDIKAENSISKSIFFQLPHLLISYGYQEILSTPYNLVIGSRERRKLEEGSP